MLPWRLWNILESLGSWGSILVLFRSTGMEESWLDGGSRRCFLEELAGRGRLAGYPGLARSPSPERGVGPSALGGVIAPARGEIAFKTIVPFGFVSSGSRVGIGGDHHVRGV